jgi:hypothetical protein
MVILVPFCTAGITLTLPLYRLPKTVSRNGRNFEIQSQISRFEIQSELRNFRTLIAALHNQSKADPLSTQNGIVPISPEQQHTLGNQRNTVQISHSRVILYCILYSFVGVEVFPIKLIQLLSSVIAKLGV